MDFFAFADSLVQPPSAIAQFKGISVAKSTSGRRRRLIPSRSTHDTSYAIVLLTIVSIRAKVCVPYAAIMFPLLILNPSNILPDSLKRV